MKRSVILTGIIAALALGSPVSAGGLHGLFRHHSGLTAQDRADEYAAELTEHGREFYVERPYLFIAMFATER